MCQRLRDAFGCVQRDRDPADRTAKLSGRTTIRTAGSWFGRLERGSSGWDGDTSGGLVALASELAMLPRGPGSPVGRHGSLPAELRLYPIETRHGQPNRGAAGGPPALPRDMGRLSPRPAPGLGGLDR